VIISPLVTARDPNLFTNANKFVPERWLTETNNLDESGIKSVHRSGASNQFGKGQHACLGEKVGRAFVKIYWSIILGDNVYPGFDIEILSGIKEGVGIDNVGVEAAWTEENLGTPFEKGGPFTVQIRKRLK
jgi:sterol 14-demethylase